MRYAQDNDCEVSTMSEIISPAVMLPLLLVAMAALIFWGVSLLA